MSLLEKIAAKLTYRERKELPTSEFAIPEERKYPVHNKDHAQNALVRVSQHGTPEERERVRRVVYRRYPELRESFEERHGESPLKKNILRKKKLGD
jgi:hypothetical protein